MLLLERKKVLQSTVQSGGLAYLRVGLVLRAEKQWGKIVEMEGHVLSSSSTRYYCDIGIACGSFPRHHFTVSPFLKVVGGPEWLLRRRRRI